MKVFLVILRHALDWCLDQFCKGGALSWGDSLGWFADEETEAHTLNDLYDRTNVKGEYQLFPYRQTGRHSPTVDLRRFDTADCIVLAEAYTNWRLGPVEEDDDIYTDADGVQRDTLDDMMDEKERRENGEQDGED